jgi:hypothetical protein
MIEVADVYEGASMHITCNRGLGKDNDMTVMLDRQDQMKLCVWLARNRETMVETALVAAREERIEKEREKDGR